MKKILEKNVLITKTAQHRSLTTLNEAEKNLTINKPKTNDEEKIMLALCDSLNGLYDNLSMLSNAMEKKIMEHNLNQKK
jgi:hypothetical protein